MGSCPSKKSRARACSASALAKARGEFFFRAVRSMPTPSHRVGRGDDDVEKGDAVAVEPDVIAGLCPSSIRARLPSSAVGTAHERDRSARVKADHRGGTAEIPRRIVEGRIPVKVGNVVRRSGRRSGIGAGGIGVGRRRDRNFRGHVRRLVCRVSTSDEGQRGGQSGADGFHFASSYAQKSALCCVRPSRRSRCLTSTICWSAHDTIYSRSVG